MDARRGARPAAHPREVLYLLNVSASPRTLTLPEAAGRAWVLHPVHRASGAADRLPAAAQVEAGAGRFTVPGRTAVVFVVEGR